MSTNHSAVSPVTNVPADERVTLTWSDVVVKATPPMNLFERIRPCPRLKGFPEKISILKGVSGVVEPGNLTALMGCSGAGKTILMNALTTRNLTGLDVEGDICANGTPVGKLNPKTIGYIQQHDVLPESLTVKEFLEFVVTLLYHKILPVDERIRKVDRVILHLSLSKCQDVLIGNAMTLEKISSGERKRVSIASQLLKDTRVLLLDEPISGLDSCMAHILVSHLRNLAASGYTIFCSIHQPSSEVFLQFDRLFLLADGRAAYSGSREGAVQYFQELGFPCPDDYNPANYFIKILTCRLGLESANRRTIEYLCDTYENSSQARCVEERIDSEYQCTVPHKGEPDKSTRIESYGSSLLVQFSLLFKREFAGFLRFPQRFFGQTIGILVMTFMLDAAFWNINGTINQRFVRNSAGILFIYAEGFGMMTLPPLVENLCDHLPLMVKEYRDGLYRASVYYVAILISEFLFATYVMAMYFFFSYFVTGLNKDVNHVFTVWAVFQMPLLSCMGFVMLCGIIVEDRDVTIELLIPVTMIYLVLGGFYLNLRNAAVYLQPFFYINWIPWAYEVVTVLQWRNNDTFIGCEYDDKSICVISGEQVIDKQGFDEDNIVSNLGIMVGQVFCYHILALSTLFYKIRHNLFNTG